MEHQFRFFCFHGPAWHLAQLLFGDGGRRHSPDGHLVAVPALRLDPCIDRL